MSFAVSFGSDSLRNGAKVNKDAAATAPVILFAQPPGYYTVTLTCETTPYMLYCKTNMISNGTRGSVVANYQGPSPNAPLQLRYTAKLWRQARRFTPPPSTPTNRTRFNLLAFADTYGLIEVGSIRFII